MANEGEEQTLGGLPDMGSLQSNTDPNEVTEFDAEGNPIKEIDGQGNEKPLTDENQEEEGSENSSEDDEPLESQEGQGDEPSGEEDKNKQEESPSDDEGSSGSSPYQSLASALIEEGALQNVDQEKIDKIEDASSLVDLLAEEFETSKKEHIKNLESTARDVADAIEKGVPIEDFRQAKSEEQEYLNKSEEDLADNEDEQKKILREEMSSRGLSENRVERHIKTLEDTGELETEAKESLKALQEQKQKEVEQMKQDAEERQKQAQEEQKQQLKKVQEQIDQKEEIVPGVELKNKDKSKVYESMTTPVGEDQNGNPLDAVMKSWMEDSEYPMKVHYLHYLTNGFTDFSKIVKGSEKRAIKNLENSVKTGGNAGQGKPKGSGKPSGGDGKDWTSILDGAMKKDS